MDLNNFSFMSLLMGKKCTNQNCPYFKEHGNPYENSSMSHYCVICGNPLEKTWGWSSEPDKRYEVIAKTELDSLRNERNRLRKQIDDSWGIKIEYWIKDNKNTILWTIATIFVLVFVGWMFTKCGFTQDHTEIIQITKDDASGKYGLYNNESNTLVTPYEYDSISHRKGLDDQGIYINFYYLYKNGKLGVADSTGEITINSELTETDGAYNGVVILQKGELKGLMDIYGHQIIPCEYKYVLWENTPQYSNFEYPGTYVGNIIPVKKNSNSDWELYDRNGRRIGYKNYYSVAQTGDPSLVKVYEKTYEKRGKRYSNTYKCGIVDESGQQVILSKYYCISIFGNDRAWAKEQYTDSWSLITSKGERLTTLSKKQTPSAFCDGMAAITENGKIGYCNTSGKLVIPMDFEVICNSDGSYISEDFYDGKARVSYKGKSGYIDKTGKFTSDSGTN